MSDPRITPHLINRAPHGKREPSKCQLHSAKKTFAGISVKLSEREYKGVADAIAKYGFKKQNYGLLTGIIKIWMGQTGIEIVDRVYKRIEEGKCTQKEAASQFFAIRQELGAANIKAAHEHSQPTITPKPPTAPPAPITIVTAPKPLPTFLVPAPRKPKPLAPTPISTRSQYIFRNALEVNGVKAEEVLHFTVIKEFGKAPYIKVRKADLEGIDKAYSREIWNRTGQQTLDVDNVAQI